MPTVLIITAFSLYFCMKIIKYRLVTPKSFFKDTFGSMKKQKTKNGISPFSALMTALGGTVGVGSILGVGYGIAVGGAGSVFWMWVCSALSMGLKYAEVRISMNGRKKDAPGGAPFRLREKGYFKLSAFFCFVCILSSFGTGSLTQISAVVKIFGSHGVNITFLAFICACVTAFAVFGGRKRISKLNTFLVPLASAAYIIICIFILIRNRQEAGNAFLCIFRNAFGFDAAAGGFSASLMSLALREGFARSIFSNEAGMGSSALAHASVSDTTPHRQGEWGMFEIFFDSFVVSTLTALCLISSGTYDCDTMFCMVFGNSGYLVLGVMTAVFACASVMSWCYYGESCLVCLRAKKKFFIFYRAAAVFNVFFGAFASFDKIWDAADILNALMLFTNLFLMFISRREINENKEVSYVVQ